MSKLADFINKNLPKVIEEETKKTLGNRKEYIGASDVAQCTRKAYLSKTIGEEHSIEKLIMFEFGHTTEDIVAKMLQGVPFERQKEITSKTSNGFNIKAHLDFFIDFGKECVVIEVKNNDDLPDEPYESWVTQIQMQMGLIKSQCNKKVRGYVIVLSKKNGFKTYEFEFSKTLFNIAMQRANELAKALQNGQEPEGEEQLYCSSCPFKGSCPKISEGAINLPKEIGDIAKKIQTLKPTEKKIKALKEELKNWFEGTGVARGKVDDLSLSLIKNKGREMANITTLKSKYPEIWEEVKTTSNPFSWVKIV